MLGHHLRALWADVAGPVLTRMDTGTVTLITVIGGLVYQAWRAERQRKWDVEDRLSIAVTLAKHSESLVKGMVTDSAATAETLAAHTSKTSERLEGLIAENTKISTDAFHEANTVNLKLEKLGLEHNRIDRQENADRNRRASDKK